MFRNIRAADGQSSALDWIWFRRPFYSGLHVQGIKVRGMKFFWRLKKEPFLCYELTFYFSPFEATFTSTSWKTGVNIRQVKEGSRK